METEIEQSERRNMNIQQLLLKLKHEVYHTMELFRVQDYHRANRIIKDAIAHLQELFLVGEEVFSQEYMGNLAISLEGVLETQRNGDNVLIADLLELQLLPTVKNMLEAVVSECGEFLEANYLEENLSCIKDDRLVSLIRQESKKAEDCFKVEFTNAGVKTLKYSSGKQIYYHSNSDPILEAEAFARHNTSGEEFRYKLFGFGFGYHVREMLKRDRRFRVKAIECNLQVLALACMNCDLRDILSNERFQLVYCTPEEIGRALGGEGMFLIHYPSLLALEDGEVKDRLNNYFIISSSLRNQKHFLDWNYYDNQKFSDENVDVIKEHFKGKTAIYMGGGPSLEDYLEYVKEQCNNKDVVVTCASTVYRKLVEKEIYPDYVFMIDPSEVMIKHVEGIPETKSKLIYLSTASNCAVKAFAGKRYIALQKGYDKAEEEVRKTGYTSFNTGGSVSTFAIDMLLHYGVGRLITIGLDLAYTDNKTHSFENAEGNSEDYLKPVKSVQGGVVYTTNVLDTYRIWVEKRISEVQEAELINLSRGAFIKGMRNTDSIDGLV